MTQVKFIWDLEDDSEGNYWHICVEGHGVTQEEVEEVVCDRYAYAVASQSSGRPMVFGFTSTGKHLAVVFVIVDETVPSVYPVTAYETPPPGRAKRRKKR
jgi:uncharacterized DUF497 family protein